MGIGYAPGVPTIIDVARHAGVSKSTVSNVLQGRASVAEPLRERVLVAIDELNYQPHIGARSLRQQSQVLGVVVGDLTNPFHAELAAKVEDEAARRHHSVLLVTTGGVSERETARVRSLLEHRVAALLYLSAPHREGPASATGSTPVVLASIASPGFPWISVDDAAGTRLAVEHLVALGHTRIGFTSLSLSDELPVERWRYKGYAQGMRRARLAISPDHLLRPGRQPQRASTKSDAVTAYLSQPDRPSAIVAANDVGALDMLGAAEAEGLRVPEDLSIVGFDDIAIASWSRVSLTTIAQPMDDIARLAVELALDVASGSRPATDNIVLEPILVIRSTTRAPQAVSERDRVGRA